MCLETNITLVIIRENFIYMHRMADGSKLPLLILVHAADWLSLVVNGNIF